MEKVISLFGMNLRVKAVPSLQRPNAPDGSLLSNMADKQCHQLVAGGNDHPTQYLYDPRDRLTKVLYPDGSNQVFAYDRYGSLRQRRTAQGRALSYAYDQRHRLRSVTDDQGEKVTYEYGTRAAQSANSVCTTVVAFDEQKRPLSVRQTIDGVTFHTDYDYDAAGRCTGIRPPGSLQWLRYDHDEKNQTLHIRAENGQSYVTLSPGEARFGNGVSQSQRLDRDGKVEEIVASAPGGRSVMDLSYRFNERWQIAQINERHFSYDAEGRLAECLDGSRDHMRYTYDKHGNRLTEQSRIGTGCYTYDECGRLLQVTRPHGSRTDYRYDRDGNRIAKRQGLRRCEYRYDAEGRLTAVWENGVCTAEYAYDAPGRRIKKKTGARITIFHYDQNGQLLAETDELGQARATYLWAGLQCLGRIRGAVGEAPGEYYHNDHLGSVQAVTGDSGEIIWKHDGDVFGRGACPFFTRKRRDDETGFYDFGARFYDPESGRFLTPDTYTGGPDDWRLLFNPERDFWGERTPQRHLIQQWQKHPHSRNRYVFCLNDPVNNIDLDGHSAWWFFLTIPSSVTWALPNTAIGLLIVAGNILMEVIGWLVWLFVCLFKRDFKARHYPWGNINPSNPFDPDDRAHLWFGLDASARLGVPWALLNGSFFVWRPYTLGNVVYAEDSYDNGLKADTMSRYVVLSDPDVQLNAQEALHSHEMQHVFQYAYLGSLFHALPIPPLVRLITGLIERGDLTERDKWWERIDLGGVAWTVGFLVHLLSFKLIKPEDVQKWINPATWWSTLLPFKWVELVSNAWNMNNWLPFVGVYEWDSKFFFDQKNSFFERDAGAKSGNVYQTVVEAEKTKIYVGEFTRVVGADAVPQATPAGVSVAFVSFTINPPVTNVGPAAAGGLTPNVAPHRINFNSINTPPVQVVNASGFYFHSLAAGSFTVQGTGSRTAATESVTIQVRDIDVKVNADAFVCQSQTIRVKGDSNAAYSIRFQTNNSGGSINGTTYTAGNTPGTDTIEIVATYSTAIRVFSKYGDNGLTGSDYVLKVIDINVKEPTITPDTLEVFVGGMVNFTMDHPPQSGTSTTQVPGSQFNLAAKQFTAGKGPIAADTVETVTLDYGCRQYTFDITVKPITATAAPDTVDGGSTAQINVSGGVSPFKFVVSDPQSTGPEVDANGRYTAGSETAAVVDTITITDRNGGGGRARVQVSVRPMTVTANPATVAVNATSVITAGSGVTPFTFAITHRESTGSTVDNNGQYRAGTAPGADTITVTDRKGTRVTVTVTVA